jgi:hypothetical protein
MGLHDSIERFAQEMGWVVKYADDGTPNFFYPIYKCKSSDLDASLPEHTHPAFIVNGQEIDRRLIAVFKGSSHNEACHSIPNMPPLVNTGADQLLAKIKACGTGFGPKTCADSGLILLLAKKNGWVPKGNNAYGVDCRDGTSFELNKSVAVGDKRVFRGWEYTALVAHTTSAEHLPSEDVGYWKKGKHVGGTPVASQYSADNSYRGYNTLTGSGPASWRLDGTISGIDDVNGNCFDQDYGYRIYDGELQVLENNNAADPSADLSASSAAWKAILPNSANNGHTLVAPGTSGTLHWTWANSKITLDTVAPTFDSEYRGTSKTSQSIPRTSRMCPRSCMNSVCSRRLAIRRRATATCSLLRASGFPGAAAITATRRTLGWAMRPRSARARTRAWPLACAAASLKPEN